MSELSGLSTSMLLNILRVCTDSRVQRGRELEFVRVVREATEEALASERTQQSAPEPASKPVWLTSEGRKTVCRTMPHQRPCGVPSCTRPECSSDPVMREAARTYGPDLVPYVMERYAQQREQD